MKKTLLLLFAAFLVITSCSKTNDKTLVQDNPAAAMPNQVTTTQNDPATGQPAAKGCKTISGSIHYVSSTTFDLPCDCSGSGAAAGNYIGTGTLTHLGLSSSKIKPCLAPIFSGAGVLIGYHVGVECNTLVAADGDELHCHILPYDIMYVGTDAVGVINIDITGGTGKFHCATGHFAGNATVHLALGTADLAEIHGTINY